MRMSNGFLLFAFAEVNWIHDTFEVDPNKGIYLNSFDRVVLTSCNIAILIYRPKPLLRVRSCGGRTWQDNETIFGSFFDLGPECVVETVCGGGTWMRCETGCLEAHVSSSMKACHFQLISTHSQRADCGSQAVASSPLICLFSFRLSCLRKPAVCVCVCSLFICAVVCVVETFIALLRLINMSSLKIQFDALTILPAAASLHSHTVSISLELDVVAGCAWIETISHSTVATE